METAMLCSALNVNKASSVTLPGDDLVRYCPEICAMWREKFS